MTTETVPIVTLNDIREAQSRLHGVAVRTRLIPSHIHESDNKEDGRQLYLKPENLQPIGSFKLRGAYNKIASLPKEALKHGVITYSSGNHAQGVAYAARAMGVKAIIVMPENAPAVKREATIALGAEIILVGPASSERQAKASGGSLKRVYSMDAAFEGADIVYPKSWAPYDVMQKRVPLLHSGDQAGLKELEKQCLANNAKFKDWECTEAKMKLTKEGKALYLHCLPADITHVSCNAGEVAASVFDRYRDDTYREASYKPYIIAAMIFASRIADPRETLSILLDRARRRAP